MPAFGPGTVHVTFPDGSAAEDFSCEVNGGSITHSYEDVDQKTRLCDTTKRPSRRVRGADGLKLSLSNDLTAEGLYARLHANDLKVATMEFTPNTIDGATWSGQIACSLPEEIGGGEWGEDIESEVELQSPGIFDFTPADGGVL